MSSATHSGSSSTAPPEPADVVHPTTTSVLQLGVPPWMRTTKSGPVTAPDARVPSDEPDTNETTQAAEQRRTETIVKSLGDVVTVQEKALVFDERRKLRVEKDRNASRANARTRQELRMCKMYFFLGLFGLPLVHLVSVMYFYKDLSGPDGDFMIRKYVCLSIIFGIVEVFLLILWFIIFRLLVDSHFEGINILSYKGLNNTLI